uniref:Uncharacterized protein n=1 Tax=Rhizophora mucronata TaxID=61149 RepID=A0A2P2P377_RHIMU
MTANERARTTNDKSSR